MSNNENAANAKRSLFSTAVIALPVKNMIEA
jgi:hypothetical protein